MFSAVFAAGACAMDGLSDPAACRATPPEIVVYQPWNNDAAVKPEQWESRLRALREGGAHTLLLQWTSYGSAEFLRAARGFGPTWLEQLIDQAIAQNWRIVFGLAADPGYFDALNRDDESVRLMLQRRRLYSLAAARTLAKKYGASPAFAGWYLPEEIDDRNWRSPGRQYLLADHLVSLGTELHSVTPDAPIYASAFFSDPASPAEFALLLLTLSDLYGGRWLVQDGLGTRRLTFDQTKEYLRGFAMHDDPEQKLLGLVEAFSETTTNAGETVYCRADAKSMAARRAVWCDVTGWPALAVFSLTHLVADADGSAGATVCPKAP